MSATMTEVSSTAVLTARLADLAPVPLDVLVDQAALQTRIDRKYVVPLGAAAALVGRLGAAALVLEIDDARTFPDESVYFDTADLLCYRLAAHRRAARFKIRTRTYVESGQCWLEVKTRDRRGRTVKHRHGYDVGHRTTLTPEGLDFISGVLAVVGLRTGPLTLRPSLVTRYRRSTLLLPDDGGRLTIDTELRCWQDPDHPPLRPRRSTHDLDDLPRCPPGLPPAVDVLSAGMHHLAVDSAQGYSLDRGSAWLPSHAVIESKTSLHASVADRRLWSDGYRPVQLSKYGTGLAVLHPELPSTRWRPVLRHTPFQRSTAANPLVDRL